jgi:hypothetical protein
VLDKIGQIDTGVNNALTKLNVLTNRMNTYLKKAEFPELLAGSPAGGTEESGGTVKSLQKKTKGPGN